MSNKPKIEVSNGSFYVYTDDGIKPIATNVSLTVEESKEEPKVAYSDLSTVVININNTKPRIKWLKLFDAIVMNLWLLLFSISVLLTSPRWWVNVFGWLILLIVAADIAISIIFFDKRDWLK